MAALTSQKMRESWFWEWLTRSKAIAESRVHLRERAHSSSGQKLARVSFDTGVRILDPVESLSSAEATSAHLALGLFRDAAFWALAELHGEQLPISEGWERLNEERRSRIGLHDGRLNLAAKTLSQFDFVQTAQWEPSKQIHEADAARELVERLLTVVEEPTGRLYALILSRWLRIASISFAILNIIWITFYLFHRVFVGTNLAEGKHWQTSTTHSGFDTETQQMYGQHYSFFFHTGEGDPEPWFELDFGSPTYFKRIEIDNRSDCCQERAVPLVVEASDDHTQWQPLAERTAPFSRWVFHVTPTTKRYLRLRVKRASTLHLESVKVYR